MVDEFFPFRHDLPYIQGFYGRFVNHPYKTARNLIENGTVVSRIQTIVKHISTIIYAGEMVVF